MQNTSGLSGGRLLDIVAMGELYEFVLRSAAGDVRAFAQWVAASV